MPDPPAIIELGSDELVDFVEDDRASILAAATSAQNIAMLTGTHGVISPPLLRPRARLPLATEIHSAASTSEDPELDRLRALVTAREGDSIGQVRARLELAYAELERDRLDGAQRQAEDAARAVENLPAAHALLRGLLMGRTSINEQLAHVQALVSSATRESSRADWLCDKARLLEARDGVTSESVAVWKEALAIAPDHVGAIYGCEAALDATNRHAEHAELLARLSELVNDAPISAWLDVERAFLLDRRLGDTSGARGVLAHALALAPGLGPVRGACVDHAIRHRDDALLATLLEAEAKLEKDAGRAARLELDSALAHTRAGAERSLVITILERAHERAPTTPLVDVRIAEELARLYDLEGRHSDALQARKAALKSLGEPREEVVALRAIAASAERAGEIDAAVLALERARVLDVDDPTLLADIDRLLVQTRRHEARAVLWMREAARVEDPLKKAAALLASADAARASGREADAAKQREAAWLTAPTAPGVYDSVAASLTPVSPEAVADRIGLYEHAVRATTDPDRKIHLLEKIAWLRDDVAGDTKGAIRTYEEILAIEPGRLSAIIGLASAATRGGDDRALARAYAAQADVTGDPAARAELRLRSATALASVDPERSLALAEELSGDSREELRSRAAELVTRLHQSAGRWERAAATLSQRADRASDGASRVALVLAEVDILINRLRTPDRALSSLKRLPDSLIDDAAVRAAMIEALERMGNEERLKTELVELADRTVAPAAKAKLLIRAAEIDDHHARDTDALTAYEKALRALPDEPLIAERIRRLGARVVLTETAAALVSPLSHAMRTIDTDRAGSAEPLLASGARDVATLRLAERLARKAGSAPQLANALSMAAESAGIVAKRALQGVATLMAWTLPPSDDYEPWERLLALGVADAASLDALVYRARRRTLGGDALAIHASIRALSKRVELASDDTERALLHLELARLRRRYGRMPEAAGEAKKALSIDPTSLTGACMLAELAAELDDSDAAVIASRTLATLIADKKARAELLRDAADLSASRGEKAVAAELLEQALHADPEAVQIAARLADVQRSRRAYADLARVLRDVLARATSAEAIIPIASELAEVAKADLKDPLIAIEALERIRSVSPNHVPTLFLLAELFIGQRAWNKALVALEETVKATSERADKLVALVGRASIYKRVLNQPAVAEHELREALAIDPHDIRTIRGLLDLGELIPKEERAQLLGRLVVGETAPAERLRALLELADARRAVGDAVGAEGALVEAASLSPDLRMLERVRAAIGRDTQTLARVLSRAVARAHEGGRAIDPTWLIGLGQIELDLGRYDEAIERFEEALRGDERRDDARVMLARALAARGRHAHAVEALTTIIVGGREAVSVDANFVRLYEASLSGAGRPTEQWVARELRAVAGDLAPGEQAELDARLSNLADAQGLGASFLRHSVMPNGVGRHPIWDLAAIASAFCGKVTRLGLQEMGSSTRDRVKPRTAHPIRPLFDRVLRAFELVEVELAVSDHVLAPVVACEDVPWVVVPSSLGSYNDSHAVASLARPMAKIALGVPWFGSLPASDVLAILVAFARIVAPSYVAYPAERIEPLVSDYELRAKKAIDRKRKRMLEELEPMLDHVGPIDEATFANAVVHTEARAAFLLSGSLRASLDAVAPTDATLAEALRVPGPPSLTAIFGHPSSRDLMTYALNSETTALRRSMGLA